MLVSKLVSGSNHIMNYDLVHGGRKILTVLIFFFTIALYMFPNLLVDDLLEQQFTYKKKIYTQGSECLTYVACDYI